MRSNGVKDWLGTEETVRIKRCLESEVNDVLSDFKQCNVGDPITTN